MDITAWKKISLHIWRLRNDGLQVTSQHIKLFLFCYWFK